MQKITLLFIFMLCVRAAHATPLTDQQNHKLTLQVAHDLAQAGHVHEAVGYVATNLPISPEHDRTIDLVYGVAELAWTFQNERRLTTARVLATEALALAGPVLKKSSRNDQEADLLGNLGVVCDRILCSPDLAEALYEAQLVVHPKDQTTAQHLRILQARRAIAQVRQKGGS